MVVGVATVLPFYFSEEAIGERGGGGAEKQILKTYCSLRLYMVTLVMP